MKKTSRSKKKEQKELELNEKQELFCKLFVSQEFYGNAVQSYAEAYNIDLEQPGKYAAARSSASTLLTKPNILSRIERELDDAGLNDNFVDKQLLFIITQQADFSSKVRAIEQYNKLKNRITDKIQLSGTIEVTMNLDA